MPTRLGNILRRAEDSAGERYGLNAVLLLPHLYAIMPQAFIDLISDAKDGLDLAVKFVYVWVAATAVALVFLIDDGPWLLICFGTFYLAWLSYRATLAFAVAYGRMMERAFDLYRFDLVRQFHLPLPTSPRDEPEIFNYIQALIRGDRHDIDTSKGFAHDWPEEVDRP
jgi:hypothetical protein